jgi:NCS1 nucleoside transporter family
MSQITPVVDDPTRDYGDAVAKVEPGGVEAIPLDERHGKPHNLFWTWTSPNMEFATITVGLLGPVVFGMDFKESVLAIVLGTLLGSVTHAVLSTWGPGTGLPQMVLSRRAFGFLGNILPAGINSIVAGIGWFAVNSVSGALALHALATGLPKPICLLIIVVAQIAIAFLGHNLIHAFERWAFPILTIVFVVGGIIVFTKADFSMHVAHGPGGFWGGFLAMFAAAFGYACGWNPYAADYTRYLPPETPRKPVGLYAGLGVLVSCVFLEIVGAAIATAGKSAIDPRSFSELLPTWLGKLALLCIAIGAVAANALNIYSGALSFVALGIRIPTHIARAVVAGVFGVIGFFVAWSGLHDAGHKYENFLLIISYWIGPWLAVVLLERIFRRGQHSVQWLGERNNVNWAGPIAMGLATAISIWLFANQYPKYVATVPTHHPALSDLTFEVGFVMAAILYALLFPIFRQRDPAPPMPPAPASLTKPAEGGP